MNETSLGGVRIRYRDTGTGPPVVFVHGLFVNGELWRSVAPAVAAAGFRCLVPDWPLGAHTVPVPAADLAPRGVAALIGTFLEQLDLRDVTLVASDTGGAYTQLLLAAGAANDRIARVVFTPSDALDVFPPAVFRLLPVYARSRAGTWLLTRLLGVRAVRNLPIAFGRLTRRPLADDVAARYFGPARASAEIRADLRRALRHVHRRHTLAAAPALAGFPGPVLLAWAADDRLFPLELGHRLAALFPSARLVALPDTYTLVPEDQPEPLARLIVEFATTHAAPAP
ncbi:alpha/beta fold hydrolase [Cryptosporangium japonicum]|uniref:Alpha/beta fold hydrolase n=1 Tax=Cryptosporangium japonicum TaxID=80872 RepID=A0ABN0V4H0_9ACTN